MVNPPPPPPPPPRVRIPKVVIYCDESRHDFGAACRFLVIGGLRLTRELKPDLTKSLNNIRERLRLRGEMKWSKVSALKLDAYKAVTDLFFDEDAFRFRCIVVETARVEKELHGRDSELAFYKFYYEMLEKWLEERAEYLILLDYKQNRGAERYTTLRRYLEQHLRGFSWISDLTVIDSRESPLAQLCDVLTGAVAAAYNGVRPESPKEALIRHIADKAGFSALRTSTGLAARKFNIFKIDLG